MNQLHFILAILIILLGVLHISFVFPIGELTEDELWFIGSGVAIILAGFSNLIILDKTISKHIQYIVVLTNVMLLCLFIIAIPIINGPQVYLGIGLFGLVAYLSSIRT